MIQTLNTRGASDFLKWDTAIVCILNVPNLDPSVIVVGESSPLTGGSLKGNVFSGCGGLANGEH